MIRIVRRIFSSGKCCGRYWSQGNLSADGAPGRPSLRHEFASQFRFGLQELSALLNAIPIKKSVAFVMPTIAISLLAGCNSGERTPKDAKSLPICLASYGSDLEFVDAQWRHSLYSENASSTFVVVDNLSKTCVTDFLAVKLLSNPRSELELRGQPVVISYFNAINTYATSECKSSTSKKTEECQKNKSLKAQFNTDIWTYISPKNVRSFLIVSPYFKKSGVF